MYMRYFATSQTNFHQQRIFITVDCCALTLVRRGVVDDYSQNDGLLTSLLAK